MKPSTLPFIIAAMLVGWCSSCDATFGEPSEPPPNPLITIAIGQSQPSSTNLGVVVVIQAKGGNVLLLQATQGSLTMPGLPGGQTSVCIGVPANDEGIFVVVSPQNQESLLSAALYQVDNPSANTGTSGGLVCPSSAVQPLAFATSPIAHPATNAAPEAGTDAGTTTNTSETGGDT